MWPSFETADWLYKVANLLLIAALAIGVIATAVVVWMGNAKEQYLSRDLADTNARAEEARATSSEANARAAELEAAAANARLETERIRKAVAWRAIPVEIAAELERALSAKPGSVNLRYMDGDPEALFLAEQYSRILRKANWAVAPGALKPTNTVVFGIRLPDDSGFDARTLRDAFTEAKVAFSTDSLPQGIGFSVMTIEGAPTLMIGSKEPALP
jgi:hypothetical protein